MCKLKAMKATLKVWNFSIFDDVIVGILEAKQSVQNSVTR